MKFKRRRIMVEASTCGQPARGLDKAYAICNPQSCMKRKDCELSEWSEWSGCSSYSNGVKRASRRITQYGAADGAWCKGATKIVAACNKKAPKKDVPPVDCEFGDWKKWTDCDATCGRGQKTRTRDTAVAAQFGGAECEGPTSEIDGCDAGKCHEKTPQACLWGQWFAWGACDKCGGQRKRTRQILKLPEAGGAPCDSKGSEETTKCKRICHEPVYCEWTDWEADGECSVTCGFGSKKFVRYLQGVGKEVHEQDLKEIISDVQLYPDVREQV